MEKNSQRPLCQANDNKCLNLAEIKGKKRDGSTKYGKWCDTHRRKGHDAKAFRNPSSVRYLPLEKCAMCNAKSTDRHRIIPGSEYGKKSVIGLCKGCHTKVHRLYDVLKKQGYMVIPQGVI